MMLVVQHGALAGVVAAVVCTIRLHQAAGSRWWVYCTWSWVLLVTDMALAVMIGRLVEQSLTQAVDGSDWLPLFSGVVAGVLGAKALILVPAGFDLDRRLKSLRKYMFDQVDEAGVARSNRWLHDNVLPSANQLGLQTVAMLSQSTLEELVRRGRFLEEDLDIVDQVAASPDSSDDLKMRSLIRIILRFGGPAGCREIIRRAKCGRHTV